MEHFNSFNDSEELRSKAPDLYRSIDILCSVIYKIKQSNKETHTKTDQIDDRLDTVDNNLSDQKNNLESEINNQKDNILSDIKSLIYPEIITILGIFTAITFAIFGGMNLLSNLFQNMKSTHTSLGQALILASVFGFTLWGLIEILFIWISKINLTKDDKNDRDNKKEDCSCSERPRTNDKCLNKNCSNIDCSDEICLNKDCSNPKDTKEKKKDNKNKFFNIFASVFLILIFIFGLALFFF